MSHGPERKEKNCLNCGTTVIGRFCHVCGQQNLEPKETVWQLVTHFFNDITHFDGKFFQTSKDLLFKPGFLSREYVNGKRESYLNPIRMYVFTSAIFFLVFFSFLQKDEGFKRKINGKTLVEIEQMDSASFAAFTAKMNDKHQPMTRKDFEELANTKLAPGLHIDDMDFTSRSQYDSLLASGKRKDSWLARLFIRKQLDINAKYHNSPDEMLSALMHTLVHSIPQMLFISLPLLALILKLLYIRRRKQFYYVSHGIFGIHLYIFLFIALLVLFTISKINDDLHSGALGTLFGFLVFGLFVYEYLAMKNFYRQGWVKTFFKFLLMNILFLIVLALLFAVFIFSSYFKI